MSERTVPSLAEIFADNLYRFAIQLAREERDRSPGQRSSESQGKLPNGYICPKCGGEMCVQERNSWAIHGLQSIHPHCNGTVQPQGNDDIRHEMCDRAIAGAMTVRR